MRPALMWLGLAACGPENEIVDHTFRVDGVWESPGILVEAPEAPRFYEIPVPYAPAVADDGTVLLFDFTTGGDVYVWNEATGIEWVTTTGAWFNSVESISADGTRILGSYGNYEVEEDTQAAIFTRGVGWEKLGALEGSLDCPMQSGGFSLTADGEVAVGLAFEGCDAFAFRWDEANGMVAYDALGQGGNRATKVSRNGALAVGFAQGDSSRTPAVWHADGTGQVLDMRFIGEFFGVNADGTLAVGQLGSKAIRWTEADGHSFLGTLGTPGQSNGRAVAVCGPNDALILGTDTLAGGVATAWTEATGLVQLTEFLAAQGLDLPENTRLQGANACTPDGRVLVGSGGTTESGTWVAILPELDL